MKTYKNIYDLVGNTPLVELTNIEKQYNLKSKIYAKVESFNPGGSVKDRIALAMINAAEKEGLINKDTHIVEPTSGNTGIGLAMVAAAKGYKLTIVMPDSMSEERRKLMKAYGANLILTPGKLGMKGAVDKANEIKNENPNIFIPSQFENMNNPKAHYLTTGKEIYDALDGNVDVFVAGIGTGGTISGVGKYLKEQNNNIKVVGVEPLSSPLLTKGVAGPHKIQGIGANFIPNTLDKTIYDEIVDVDDNEAINMSKELARNCGLLAGISSGAATFVSLQLAKKLEGKNIVVLLPDTGERYLSILDFDK